MTASLAPAPKTLDSALTEFAQGWWDNTLSFRTLFMNALAGFCASDLSDEDVQVLAYCLQNALLGVERVDYPLHIAPLRERLLNLMAESGEIMLATHGQRRSAALHELRAVQRSFATLASALSHVGIQP